MRVSGNLGKPVGGKNTGACVQSRGSVRLSKGKLGSGSKKGIPEIHLIWDLGLVRTVRSAKP